MTSTSDLRVSLLTPNGPAGVAVIELRGSDLAPALARVGIEAPAPGTFSLVHLHAGGERLDEALCCAREAGRIELHVHGSVPLVREILEILDPEPIAASGPELSLQEACWQAMSEAPSEWGARIALAQSEGSLGAELRRLVELTDGEFRAALQVLRKRGQSARRWLEPTRIALQGPPNAGKSTLFNALIGFERVVTSEEAGTTRDPVLESICLSGWPVELVDTAGLRAVEDASLEGRGQILGRRLADSAEVIFYLRPFGDGGEAPVGTHTLITHGDREGAPSHAIDALHGPLVAAEKVGQQLGEILGGALDWQLEWPAPCTPGQRDLLDKALAAPDLEQARQVLAAAL